MLFPAVIGLALAVVLGLLFWSRGQAHRETLLEATVESLDPAEAGQREQIGDDIGSEIDAPKGFGGGVPVIVALAGIITFVSLMEWLGFVPMSFLFLAAFMCYLGTRLSVALPVSAAVACLTYHLFTRMGATLPWGLLGW
jgi:hypothetical protein